MYPNRSSAGRALTKYLAGGLRRSWNRPDPPKKDPEWNPLVVVGLVLFGIFIVLYGGMGLLILILIVIIVVGTIFKSLG